VPLRDIVIFGIEASEIMEMPPLAVLPDTGVNVTLRVKLCPAVNVSGKATPLKVKPVPAMAA
jgi:hypothetical protein